VTPRCSATAEASTKVYRWADRRDMVTIDSTVNLELPEQGASREWSTIPAAAIALVDALPEGQRAL
jgi:hypothetical protein